MIKSQLIARLAAENPNLSNAEVERVVAAILDGIVGALERGGRVELRDFGTFSVRPRAPRKGRNPRTGGSVAVPASWAPFFRSGKNLRKRLNASADS